MVKLFIFSRHIARLRGVNIHEYMIAYAKTYSNMKYLEAEQTGSVHWVYEAYDPVSASLQSTEQQCKKGTGAGQSVWLT